MIKRIVGTLSTVFLLAGCGQGVNEKFSVIAHRGASAYVPENTLASYVLAETMDADYIELDIHLTKDHELVVMHDQDISATTEGTGEIGDYTLDELKQLSANFRYQKNESKSKIESSEMYAIPELSEVLSQFGETMSLVIELKDPDKYPGIEGELVNLLEEYEMIGLDDNNYPRAVIQSFDKSGLIKISKLNSDIPLIQLYSFEENEKATLSEKEIDEILSYAAGIGVNYESLAIEFIKEMGKNKIPVYAFTVNEVENALKMKAMGVSGIYTDRPDLLD